MQKLCYRIPKVDIFEFITYSNDTRIFKNCANLVLVAGEEVSSVRVALPPARLQHGEPQQGAGPALDRAKVPHLRSHGAQSDTATEVGHAQMAI